MLNELRALMRVSSLQEQYRSTSLFVEEYYLEQLDAGRPWVPLVHFHEVGWRRKLNPSPFFDVAFYLESNEDVRRAGINPLLHYLEYGWKEGRSPHPNFDPRGFRWAHPESDPNVDAAAECIRLYGTLFWRKKAPGATGLKGAPKRAPREEVGVTSERAWRGLQKIRSQIAAIFQRPVQRKVAGPSPTVGQPVGAANYLHLDELRGNHISGWAWSSVGDAEGRQIEVWCGEVQVGHCLRHIKRPDVDRHLNAPEGAKGFLLPVGCLAALGQLLGGQRLDPTVRFGDQVQSLMTGAPALRDLASFRTMRGIEGQGGWQVADLWWANSRLLKLRTSSKPGEGGEPSASSLRVFQPLPQSDGRLTLGLVDELALSADTSIATISVRNPLMPILFAGYDDTGEMLFTDLIPFPSLLRGGLHETEVPAVGPQGGTLQDFCRLSDAYLAEAVGWGQEGLTSTIAEIEVDLATATGAEPIFDPSVGVWLTAGFDVQVAAANIELRVERDLGDRSFVDYAMAQLARVQPGHRRVGRSRLSLPSRAIPSVGAIVSRRLAAPSARQPGPHIVADEAFPHRRYLVAFPGGAPQALYPGLHAGLGEMPYLTRLGSAGEKEDRNVDYIQPLAILFQDLNPQKVEALKVFPVPKDQPDVIVPQSQASPVKASVIVPVMEHGPAIGTLLSTLATQVSSVDFDIVIAMASRHAGQTARLRETLATVLPQRGQIVEAREALNTSEALNQAAAAATGDVLLFVGSSVILHDHRTVETLARIACLDGIGTVGCMHLKSRQAGDGLPTFSSAGYFPARVDFAIAPHLALNTFDCSDILPKAIYPVVANSPYCFAVSKAAWQSTGGLSVQLPNTFAEIDLAVRMAEAGYTNVCTTLLSVFTDADGLNRITDTHAPTNLTLWRLLPAIKTSTLIRAY